MARFSHSQLTTYTQCQLKYRFQYIDKIATEKQTTSHMLLGSSVHYALEKLYKSVSVFSLITKDELKRIFIEYWNEGKQSLIELLLPQDEEIFLHRGSTYLDWYYDTYAPFDQARPWGFEMNVSYQINSNTTISGIIDRLDAKGDTVFINDYKTNQSLYPDDKDDHEKQICIYGLAIQQKYGNKFKNFVGKVIYLHIQKEYEIPLTKQRLEARKNEIIVLIREIQHKAGLYNGGLGDTNIFSHTPGDHCKFCPFQMICPAWSHKYKQEEYKLTELGEKSIHSLIDEYAILSKKINELTKEKKSIGTLLSAYMNESNFTKIYSQKYVISTRNDYKLQLADEQECMKKILELGLAETFLKINDTQLVQNRKNASLPTELSSYISVIQKRVIARSTKIDGDEDNDEVE